MASAGEEACSKEARGYRRGMPRFECQVCRTEFEVEAATLAKFPGWRPKYCRAHSPKRSAAGGRESQSAGGRGREENLTLDQVLARYPSGPRDGVFTDGSAIPNPGPGGWGFVWVEDGEVRAQGHGHAPATTNNRMELVALIEGYRALPGDARVEVHSDSRLCVNTVNLWAPEWERRGWTRKGGAIQNLELVRELVELARAHPACPLRWIAAHSGQRWNEYADSLATAWNRDVL